MVERARNAVYWTPDLTLSGLTQSALSAYIDAIEAEGGEAFFQGQGELKLGRPLKF